MDKDYFLDAGIQPSFRFEHLHSSSPLPTWETLSSASELNCSSEFSPDCYLNNNWDRPIDRYSQFGPTPSSMVSSPSPSNSAVSKDSFAIRELIGKLGNICNSDNISPNFLEANCYVGGEKLSASASCYSTPVSSPSKLLMPNTEQFVKENLSDLGNSVPVNSSLPTLSADPGFAERAAKFSCFGSRSLNGRMSQFGVKTTEWPCEYNTLLLGNRKLSGVSSSPAIKEAGSPTENKSAGPTQMEIRPASGSVFVSDKKLKLSGSSANSNEESSVSKHFPRMENRERTPSELTPTKRKGDSKGKPNAAKGDEEDASNAKRTKSTEGAGNSTGDLKKEETRGIINTAGDESLKEAKSNSKPPEPPKDYIHVRARRGQATDSHSLAERVRREKISERMKLLQDLVPGCNKVTGKALMLDEIINYVQSLQRQVEFLSMKLSSVNSDMDNLLSKDRFQPNGRHPIYPLDSSAPALYGRHPQHSPHAADILSNGGTTPYSVDHPFGGTTPGHDLGMQLPAVNNLGGLPKFQAATLEEDELQSVIQMGIGQNSNN